MTKLSVGFSRTPPKRAVRGILCLFGLAVCTIGVLAQAPPPPPDATDCTIQCSADFNLKVADCQTDYPSTSNLSSESQAALKNCIAGAGIVNDFCLEQCGVTVKGYLLLLRGVRESGPPSIQEVVVQLEEGVYYLNVVSVLGEGKGAPHFELEVDGVVAISPSALNRTVTAFSIPISLTAGSHTFTGRLAGKPGAVIEVAVTTQPLYPLGGKP